MTLDKLLFLISFFLESSTIDHVRKNNPYLRYDKVLDVSFNIDYYSNKYSIDPIVASSLFMVESSYIIHNVNKKSNDYGIGQINLYNIRVKGLDPMRLIFDTSYSVEEAIKVFKWFSDRYVTDIAVRRYNCGLIKSCIYWKSVKNYKKKIESYL